MWGPVSDQILLPLILDAFQQEVGEWWLGWLGWREVWVGFGGERSGGEGRRGSDGRLWPRTDFGQRRGGTLASDFGRNLGGRLWPNRLWPICSVLVFWPNFQPKSRNPKDPKTNPGEREPDPLGSHLSEPLRGSFAAPPPTTTTTTHFRDTLILGLTSTPLLAVLVLLWLLLVWTSLDHLPQDPLPPLDGRASHSREPKRAHQRVRPSKTPPKFHEGPAER